MRGGGGEFKSPSDTTRIPGTSGQHRSQGVVCKWICQFPARQHARCHIGFRSLPQTDPDRPDSHQHTTTTTHTRHRQPVKHPRSTPVT